MPRLTPEEARDRRVFDFEALIATDRASEHFRAAAFTAAADVDDPRKALGRESAHLATHWRWLFDQPTLAGRGRTTHGVTVHVDVAANGNFPFTPPACWVLSRPIPWSAHFREGMPICLGNFWDPEGGTLLAELAEHVSRLLNFDEVARGSGYVGWNAESIAYWNRQMRGGPLVAGFAYPRMPAAVVHPGAVTATAAEDVFRPKAAAPSAAFRAKELR